MSFDKVTYIDKKTRISAKNLNDIQNEIESLGNNDTLLSDEITDLRNTINEVVGDVPQLVQETVNNWLIAHPEATTTVQDGSLTYQKLVNGTLGFVTPEMFGAVGDGVADDTQALVNAIQFNKPLFLEKTYRIVSTIRINNNLYMFGSGAVYMQNKNAITSMFEVQTAGIVRCDGIKFYSERENTNVFAPAGHTRVTGSKSSNIIAFSVYAVDNLTMSNCVCENLEYDVKTSLPSSGLSGSNEIVLKNHKSINYSTCAYISYTNNFIVIGGTFSCYELLGSGDHCFYGSANVDNVYIFKPVINSYPKTGTTFDLHFSSSYTDTGTNIVIDGAILHSNSFLATNYKGDIIIRNCSFYALGINGVSASFNPISLSGAKTFERTSPMIFENCYFSPRQDLQAPMPLKSPVIFKSCIFDGWVFSMQIADGDNQDSNKYVFDNCSISAKETDTAAMFYCGAIAYDYEISICNSNLYQKLGDGFASLRGSGSQIIAFYNCHLQRESTKPYLEYASSYNGVYKFLNCCSEYGKMRKTGSSATFIDINNGFAQ